MRQSQNSPKPNPLSFFLNLDPLTSLVLLILAGLSISIVVGVTWNLISRNKVHQLTLVAGSQVFSQAATDLIKEKISQESFRTFNEAYKTSREAIEHQLQLAQKLSEKQTKIAEQKQRELSSRYVKAVVELLQDEKRGKNLIQQELDQLLKTAAINLIQDKISQESFRTFIEAYKTTRDSLERKHT